MSDVVSWYYERISHCMVSTRCIDFWMITLRTLITATWNLFYFCIQAIPKENYSINKYVSGFVDEHTSTLDGVGLYPSGTTYRVTGSEVAWAGNEMLVAQRITYGIRLYILRSCFMGCYLKIYSIYTINIVNLDVDTITGNW